MDKIYITMLIILTKLMDNGVVLNTVEIYEEYMRET